MQQSNQQLHLTVPEQPTHLVNDESPIDRYGPLSRGVTDSGTYPRFSGRSSCYSRDTDEYSLYGGVERRESVRQDYVDGIPIGYSRDTDEYSLYGRVERRENGRQEYVDGIPIGDIQRPTPVHLSVNTARYTTQHGNESKLIIQGLSDPYKTGSSPVSARQEVNAVDDSSWRMYSSSELGLKPIWPLRIDSRNPREQSPLLSSRRQNWQTAEWPGSKSIERPSVPPIRPERWSAVSPSFRTPTSLVSPFKRPPSIVISTIAAGSTSQLGKYSTGPKSPYSNSHRQYPPKMDMVLIGIAVALATFCTAMDRVIIPTAVPAITDQFNTIEDIGWYGTSYLLTASSAQLLYGKLYQFYTAKWVYIAALAVFELGSIVSGAASVSPLIIFGRALAGVGAAGVLSGSVLILGQCVRLGQKSVYFGILAGVHGVALVIGPLLGGILTQYASWRWCFFINIPFGLISCILLVASNWDGPRNASSQSTPQDKLALLDLEGTLLFLPSIVCLLLALQWGGVEYPWTSASEIVLFAVFLVTIIGFILIQYYKNELASIPPRIFLNRNVYGGMLASFCLGGSIALMVYYLPLWFQVAENASPLQSGVLLLPLVLTLAITSIASASLVNIVGYYTPFLVFASVVMSISSGLLTTLEDSTPVSAWIGYQILFGLGAGSGIHQTALGIQASFQKHRDIAVGTVMITFAQTLGAAVAIGMGQSVFENSLVNGIQAARLGDVSVQRVLHTGAMDLRKVFDGNDLDTVLHLYTHAIDQAFYVSVGLTTVSILGVLAMEWSSVRGRRAPVVLG